MQRKYDADVLIIGAGPAGSVAACLLRKLGYQVKVLEKTTFPRFVIGESLLPQCMTTLEQAGCLEAVVDAGFQEKVGATFQHKGHYEQVVFNDKFTAGPSSAYHVERARFDHILSNCASEKGAEILFDATVMTVKNKYNDCVVEYQDKEGQGHTFSARFILDASGYGRVLPRLLGIDKPSSLEPKASLFTHVEDHITTADYSRSTTLITTHPLHRDVWFWLISFNNGRSSVGVVGRPEIVEPYQKKGITGLQGIINEDPELSGILQHAKYDTEAFNINAYSGNVTQFHGEGYAVLGNAGEFLDPIFSSGVTVALHSSQLAVNVLDQMLKGEDYDWDESFVKPLKVGVETFKTFVTEWYSGGFQDVIYSSRSAANVKSKIASILAGYAWDLNNPYVANPNQRLNTLIQICRQ